MDQNLQDRITASLSHVDVWNPEFIRLGSAEGDALFQAVIALPGIQVHDGLRAQVKELVRSLTPSVRYSPEELERAAEEHVGSTGWLAYGVWVFYPWSNRLVHLLDEAEFALVRTDRNRNKITREEQAVLSTKRVGVMGLSVGQSIALTMALERSFGEIRLADFDTLDLSNLNRIRSGVHNLGLRKVVNVAREIMEIDPFLKITCFPEGITRDNIDAFCTEGGKLDVLVDECDSVDVKIFARQTAKRLGIPVVMDTSDRGMIDVERFDLEPGRPILHGLIEVDETPIGDVITPEQRLKTAMAILGGARNLSERMASTLPEIGKSVTTWPQLAASVMQGGGNAANACRRIFLGLPVHSGRWHVDVDAMLQQESLLRSPLPSTAPQSSPA